MNAFSTYHPILLVTYLLFVCFVTVTSMHPILIAAAWIGAVSYFVCLKGVTNTLKELFYYCFFGLLIFLSYSTFVHNGYTPLFFMNDQPITLQALIKGLATATTVVALCFYIKCYFHMFTTTKVLFVVSKLSAKVGILLSMTFRFIPLCKESYVQRKQAMTAIGYFQTSSQVDKLLRKGKLLMHTIIVTAELVFFKPSVMTARGYGSRKRTQYAIIRYRKKDLWLGLLLVAELTIFIALYEVYTFYYYPLLKDVTLSVFEIILISLVFLFPTLYEMKENAKWRYLQSKI